MAMFESRSYLQKEVVDVKHLNMHLTTFQKYQKREKDFPKPFFVSGNKKQWDGDRLQYFIDKKSGR
ncbi:hypothetical protein AB3K25_06560 [Leuconostoc sp. MS02]|uniref:Uncharacterized protein n=1 Tax=Leuconostoc aquikimchii TaxID=3236804 RepID=A0ABV3S1W0_9LACO